MGFSRDAALIFGRAVSAGRDMEVHRGLMDKYKKLLSNTVIFAIGTFSSKLLVFFLTPFYTSVLSSGEFGTGDLISQTANLIIPLITLGIVNGIIRFGLDRSVKKDDVLSTGLIVILGGYLLLLPFYPLVSKISLISGYSWLVYLFVLTSSMRSLFSQFVRVRGYVKLYSFDGILSTATTILFNILFLKVFALGVTGFVLATICADALSAIFLFFTASLHRYVKFQGIRRRTAVDMLKYSIPLIPNMLFWWITNSSDKFVVGYLIDNSASGLINVAYKIPMMINLVATFFLDAWQMSAVTEEKGREKFFSKVFRSYSSVVFLAASGIILCSPLIMQFFVVFSKDPQYDLAWKYVPFLVLGTAFSCLVTFLGSVYTVEKKSVLSMITMAVGAGVNLLLNILLVPIWGVQGAAFATFVSYGLVFILRAVNTRRYIDMGLNTGKILFNTVLLAGQAVLLILEAPYWWAFEIGITLLMLLVNGRSLLESVAKLLHRRRG